ncbi:hypothetical protein DFH28DRAFT_1103585 [Melampsora americana]|nr:hypothetical protein DFH28DRAFT_1103585 [Melampsora americana]
MINMFSSDDEKKEAKIHHERMMHDQDLAWMREREIEQASKIINLSVEKKAVPSISSKSNNFDLGDIEKDKEKDTKDAEEKDVVLKRKKKEKKESVDKKKIKLSVDKKAVPSISSKLNLGDIEKDNEKDTKDAQMKDVVKRKKKEKKVKGWKGWVLEEMDEDPVEDAVVDEVEENGAQFHGGLEGMRRSQRMKRKMESMAVRPRSEKSILGVS